ncbi:MAG: UDP-4-amino-4,6-dideoxy-N-acetyl-beta-L-altrosamine N-acetyltransferase [Syntrophorhabdaceae bacterium]|nr:UDP-4-amino-4,6-dideoxy-N-acetyl-beta-L-altrosamine N-acetyltransferase [Syntrophorhabdaceae bacterium]MDD5242394.1 UDP-4-amino-4,6-dideoxy-N-acetyl-beta-L-altrosamine N-acetyltransferase [Syntrophorhabdaceae bacterium]
MIKDLSKNFNIGDVRLISFLNLNGEEKEMVRRWRNSAAISKWMYQDHRISKKEHAAYIKYLATRSDMFCWVVKKKDIYVGVINLKKVDQKNGNAYLGIYTNPDSGIPKPGTLLIDCLKNLSFNILRLHTLKLEVLKNNRTALSFYRRSGFTREGVLHQFVMKGGQWHDVVIMGLINKEGE